jgi:two-component system alkaline phosphatase synthesis response regulator PhoP
MSNKTILIVDDEPELRELLSFTLSKEGYKVLTAADGQQALDIAFETIPDLILLDLMLPGIDGYDVCSAIKRNPSTKGVAIIMVSAKTDELDQLVGLKLGADDYISKPFSPKILAAKVAAFFRSHESRSTQKELSSETAIDIEGLIMNPERFTVSYKGAPQALTAIEYKLLYSLALKPGRVYSRNQIIEKVRGDDVVISGRNIDVHILSIRRKLKDNNIIETVRGIGYKFREF